MLAHPGGDALEIALAAGGIDHHMAELVGEGDEITLRVDDGLLDEGGALLEEAAQEMRLAGAGIALDEQARRQKLLQIEQSRLSSGGGGCRSHVDADLHQPPSCSYGKPGPVLTRGERGKCPKSRNPPQARASIPGHEAAGVPKPAGEPNH